MPQTRFVLEKAIQRGLKIILAINKVDRNEVKEPIVLTKSSIKPSIILRARCDEEQTEFPIVYACARQGWCTSNSEDIPKMIAGEKTGDLSPLFDLIVEQVSPPKVDKNAEDFTMLVSNLDYSGFVGQTAVGSPLSGSVKKNDKIFCKSVDEQGKEQKKAYSVTKIFLFEGLKQVESDCLEAGDIGLVAGYEDIKIGDTLSNNPDTPALERIVVEEPTLGMIFSINTSPLSGQEGEAVQSRKLRERLIKATRYNVALRFVETDSAEQFRILGRGEPQFAILIEQMRREGLEFMAGRLILFHTDENGQKLEPIERAVLDLPETFSGEVTEMLQKRKGIMASYENLEAGRVRLAFDIPTRGLLGIHSRYLTATRGEGLFSSQVLGYEPFKGEMLHRQNGSLISDRDGDTVEYALKSLEERGQLFVGPGVKVYEGMILGECAKDNDLNVNACKEKKLTNVRAAGSDGLIILSGIKKMSLENCIEWIDDDEWIEVTPENIRLRKKVLAKNMRSVKRK